MNSETIEALETRLEAAMLDSDVEALDELLDDRLVFTNHVGQRMTKRMDLDAHRSGIVDIESIRRSDQSVTLFDGVAIVSVLSEICGSFGGVRSTAEIRFTRVWQQRNGEEFRLIAAHSSLDESA